MAHNPAPKRAQNGQRTITLPILGERYAKIIDDPKRFREEWLDPHIPNCRTRIARNFFRPGSTKATK